MSIILANFGKYAISDCPFIHYVHRNSVGMVLIDVHDYVTENMASTCSNVADD